MQWQRARSPAARTTSRRCDAPRSRAEQPPRRERIQQSMPAAREGPRDQVAAEEAEHVAVPRVAACDPDAFAARDLADDGEKVEHEPEDPRPAVRDLDGLADQSRDELFQCALNRRRRLLVGRELRVKRIVAEPTGEDPSVLELLPVVEAVPAVMRTLEEPLLDRRRGEHLSARRDDQPFEGTQEPARITVGRDDYALRLEPVERRNALPLAKLDACLRCFHRDPAHGESRLQRRVARVKDPGREASCEQRGEPVAPLRLETVFSERVVLAPKLVALVVVGGDAEAAGPPQRVAGAPGQALEGFLGQLPVLSRALGAHPHTRLVVRRRSATEGEAAVAPARAARYLARVVDADVQPGTRQRQRTRAAGHACADDLDVGPVDSHLRQGQRLFRKPPGCCHSARSYAFAGDALAVLVERHVPAPSAASPASSSSARAAATAAAESPVARATSSADPGNAPSTRPAGPSMRGGACSGIVSPNSSSTSCADVAGVAPSRSSAFVPADRAEVISPGTASTSRPSSSAKSAVISAPLRSRASTTTVAAHRPAMMRFRAGKRHGAGSVPGGYSETTSPCARISSARRACAAG